MVLDHSSEGNCHSLTAVISGWYKLGRQQTLVCSELPLGKITATPRARNVDQGLISVGISVLEIGFRWDKDASVTPVPFWMQTLSTVYSWSNTGPYGSRRADVARSAPPAARHRAEKGELARSTIPGTIHCTASSSLRAGGCFTVLTPPRDAHWVKCKCLGTGRPTQFSAGFSVPSAMTVFIMCWKWKICGKRNSQSEVKQNSSEVIEGRKVSKKHAQNKKKHI